MGLVQAGHIVVPDGPGTEPLLSAAAGAEEAVPRPVFGADGRAAGVHAAVADADASARLPLLQTLSGFQVPRDALDRIVMGLLQMFAPGRLDDLHSPRVASVRRQLRHRVVLVLFCTILTAPIAVVLLVHGVATYVTAREPSCGGPLRIWLSGFLLLQCAWPICMPSLTLLLLGWCLGALVLLHGSADCPMIHTFLVEASALQMTQAVLLLVAAIALLTARPLVQRLLDILSYGGTDPEVLRHIVVLPNQEVPQDEECVICLSREDEDEVPWRELPCRHRFHEPCLLEWLVKARRCPVCRLDLHIAYRRLALQAVTTAAAPAQDSQLFSLA